MEESERIQSSLRDWKGIDWPNMALTSSSFLALPVTNVTGRDTSIPVPALAAAMLLFFAFGYLVMFSTEDKRQDPASRGRRQTYNRLQRYHSKRSPLFFIFLKLPLSFFFFTFLNWFLITKLIFNGPSVTGPKPTS